MRIITFQHPAVLDSINKCGVYLSCYKGHFHQKTPKSYRFLIDSFRDIRENVSINYPIFGWSQVLDVGIPINESDIAIKRMLEMTPMPEDYSMLVLEVPDNMVMETDFYGFVDMRFSEEYPDDDFVLTKEGIDSILKPRENNIIEIQAVLGYISKDWVKDVIHLRQLKKVG